MLFSIIYLEVFVCLSVAESRTQLLRKTTYIHFILQSESFSVISLIDSEMLCLMSLL